MKTVLACTVLLAAWLAPAHVGVPSMGPGGLRWTLDEAQARRFGGMRSFGFRGSRGLFRSRSFPPRRFTPRGR